VLITLHDGETTTLLIELESLIESRKTFFRGGQVTLQVGERRLYAHEITRVRQILSRHNIALLALSSSDPVTCATAERLDVPTRRELAPSIEERYDRAGMLSAYPDEPAENRQEVGDRVTGILIKRHLRSGQTVRCAGHVVVLGDVERGAEVIAGGDVVVWGHVRGLVHAGAQGNPRRCVCALDLSSSELRIGRYDLQRPKKRRWLAKAHPVRAQVRNGEIVVERWRPTQSAD
jgi:septum site-determining protein MinC